MKLLSVCLSVALLGASPCFGDKPVTCEAWEHVFTCDKWGCVRYPGVPVPQSPRQIVQALHGDNVQGETQWIDDGTGVLSVQCIPSVYRLKRDTNQDGIHYRMYERIDALTKEAIETASCPLQQGWPIDIPAQDFRLVGGP